LSSPAVESGLAGAGDGVGVAAGVAPELELHDDDPVWFGGGVWGVDVDDAGGGVGGGVCWGSCARADVAILTRSMDANPLASVMDRTNVRRPAK